MVKVDMVRVEALLRQGKSQRAVAKELGVSRTTLQRLLKKGVLPGVPEGVSAEMVALREELAALREELAALRGRRERTSASRIVRKTRRVTYHIEPRLIERIRSYAEQKRVTVTEVVNQIVEDFFE